MPTADQHQSATVSKILMIGDSGAGKTGALLSLLLAGHHVAVIDMDNGLDFLVGHLRRHAPDKLKLLSFQSFRDKYKTSSAGIMMDGMPSAYPKAITALDKWDDGTKPGEWGTSRYLVIDSLTFLASAAFDWKQALNPSVKDNRQIYGAAQEAIEEVLAFVTSPAFNTNLIVTSHIRWINRPDGTMKGYPTAIGEALSSRISTYFNTTILVQSISQGSTVKRTIQTVPTALIDLKNPGGPDVPPTLPLETGLLTFFEKVRA